jgi:hypothetical protein
MCYGTWETSGSACVRRVAKVFEPIRCPSRDCATACVGSSVVGITPEKGMYKRMMRVRDG